MGRVLGASLVVRTNLTTVVVVVNIWDSMLLKAVQMLLLSGSSAAAAGFVPYRWNWRTPHPPPPGYLYNIHITVTSPPPHTHTHVQTHTTSGRGSFSAVCLSSSIFSPLAHFFPSSCRRRLRDLRALSTLSDSSSPSPSSSASLQLSTGSSRRINFCQWCGGPTKHEVPVGEEKMRAICSICGKIAYQNPKMVVGCLIEHDNRVLLCKRNIEPSYGLWTLPAGYMEMGESAAEGAVRETWEEAGAEVDVISPFAQLDIPLIGQTYVIFLAKLKKPHFSPGPESSECQLFAYDDIPFDSLAFSSMLVTLNLYIEDMKNGSPKFHYGTINKRPGTRPSDIHAYTLGYHLQTSS